MTKKVKPLVVLPTTTDTETLRAVSSAGYVAVLCDDPDKVKVILAGSDVSGSDLLMSALHGVCSESFSSDCRGKMVTELFRRMKAREENT